MNFHNKYFKENKPFREAWQGKLGIKYEVIQETDAFIKFIKDKNISNPSILELGAGDGYSSDIIRKALIPKRYVTTDISFEGVKRMKERGFEAYQADAMNLIRFDDNSFDVVFAFGVMHHVLSPGYMTREILRVTKKYFFLVEVNGLCLPRKLLEHSPRNGKAGERSYLPLTYKSFFEEAGQCKIKPFNFVYAGTPDFLYRIAVVISELLKKLPIIKYFSSTLIICGEK